jgi:hypothetical protein
MIELRYVLPVPLLVTRLAAGGRAVRLSRCHAGLELPLMRILVTAVTVQVGESEVPRLGVAALGIVVALPAGYGGVRSEQRKAGLLVPRQGKGGSLESLYAVAFLAAIQVRRGGKLVLMFVGVAVRTLAKLDSIIRGLTSRHVALRARNRRVAALQWVTRNLVRGNIEQRGLPAVDGVASGALALVRTAGKLAVVRIGLVTVRAFGVSYRRFEVAREMTLGAGQGGMSTRQRKLRACMVEPRT